MSSKHDISIDIANIIPHGNAQCTEQIIARWQELRQVASDCSFSAPVKGKPVACTVSMDVEGAVSVMEAALEAGSFDAYRLKCATDSSLPVGATLAISIESADSLSPIAAFEVATFFLQQVVVAMNIAFPGSIQLLKTSYGGDQSHQVEAPVFDAVVFFGARNALLAHHWPTLPNPSLAAVWAWLDGCEFSGSLTAINSINKVLFTLLKIAEQRQDFSARTVLMVIYQLEVLMDCHNAPGFKLLRNRIRQVLGDIPETADCLKDLYQVRGNLYGGDQPVRRPMLIRHSSGDEMLEQLDQQDNMVELGVLLAIALLQDLVVNQARGYGFTESFSRLS